MHIISESNKLPVYDVRFFTDNHGHLNHHCTDIPL